MSAARALVLLFVEAYAGEAAGTLVAGWAPVSRLFISTHLAFGQHVNSIGWVFILSLSFFFSLFSVVIWPW